MLKPFPRFASDAEAEDFVANADLTEYDWSSLRRVRLTFAPKTGVAIEDVAPEEPADPSGSDIGAFFAAKAVPGPSAAKRRAGAGGRQR